MSKTKEQQFDFLIESFESKVYISSRELIEFFQVIDDPDSDFIKNQCNGNIPLEFLSPTVEILSKPLAETSDDERKAAIACLGNIREREALPCLLNATQHQDGVVRKKAFESLRWHLTTNEAKALILATLRYHLAHEEYVCSYEDSLSLINAIVDSTNEKIREKK